MELRAQSWRSQGWGRRLRRSYKITPRAYCPGSPPMRWGLSRLSVYRRPSLEADPVGDRSSKAGPGTTKSHASAAAEAVIAGADVLPWQKLASHRDSSAGTAVVTVAAAGSVPAVAVGAFRTLPEEYRKDPWTRAGSRHLCCPSSAKPGPFVADTPHKGSRLSSN